MIGPPARPYPLETERHPFAARTMGPVKVSTRGDYAARALLSMALHGYDRPTSVKEIAERTGDPVLLARSKFQLLWVRCSQADMPGADDVLAQLEPQLPHVRRHRAGHPRAVPPVRRRRQRRPPGSSALPQLSV